MTPALDWEIKFQVIRHLCITSPIKKKAKNKVWLPEGGHSHLTARCHPKTKVYTLSFSILGILFDSTHLRQERSPIPSTTETPCLLRWRVSTKRQSETLGCMESKSFMPRPPVQAGMRIPDTGKHWSLALSCIVPWFGSMHFLFRFLTYRNALLEECLTL